MTPGGVRALEDRICLTFPKLLPVDAHARTRRVAGVTAWRCPFGAGHWHAEELDPVLLLDMATMLRERGQAPRSLESTPQAG